MSSTSAEASAYLPSQSNRSTQIARQANANVVSKLTVQAGMKAFEPAIAIFNKLSDLCAAAGPFLKHALRGTTKFIRVIEGLQGNRELYASYIEKALKVYERFVEGAKFAKRAIRPGTVAAFMLEVLLKDITATREEIKEYSQLGAIDKLGERGDIKNFMESRTTWLDRTLANMTVQKISGLVLGSDLAFGQTSSPKSLLQVSASAMAVGQDDIDSRGPEEARPIEELCGGHIDQALGQILTEIMASSALRDEETGKWYPAVQTSASNSQGGLARRSTTHRQEQFRRHRRNLRDLFLKDGSPEEAEPSSPDTEQEDGNPKLSASNLVGRIRKCSIFDPNGTAMGVLQPLVDGLEELDLLKQEVTILQIIATLFRDKFASNGRLRNRISLAWALLHLSSLLYSVARREEALAAAEEATSTIEAIIHIKPESKQYLAASLKITAICKLETGDVNGAIDIAEQALHEYRSLHGARPHDFKGHLADMLLSYSTILIKGAKQEKAISAIEESVRLYRTSQTTRPQEFRAGLAITLYHHSLLLNEVGRKVEAVRAIEEATAIQRALHEARPAEFKADYARTLSQYAVQLFRAGKHGKGFEAIKECLEMRRTLHRERPKSHKTDLAWTLSYYSVQLGHRGRHKDAIIAIEESLMLRRSLYAMRPGNSDSELARTLATYANHLSKGGRHEDALKAIEESVGMYQSLIAEQPTVHGEALSKARKQHLTLLQRVRPAAQSHWRRR
ncbi:hypothetical protein CF326_g5785 [Tilletia indica]|nr:hypothetical protein CF326_g5785 [Tilletia indica]